eukprot:m.338550 g.338550  ORF g.338550 m.338550 type:complete len:429 (+) comp20559_c0_seq4:141-1427(+)
MLPDVVPSVNSSFAAKAPFKDDKKRTLDQAERYITWAAELGCAHSHEAWGAQLLNGISKRGRLASCGIEPDRLYCATVKSIVTGRSHSSYESAVDLLLQLFAWSKKGWERRTRDGLDYCTFSGKQHRVLNSKPFHDAILALKTELVLTNANEVSNEQPSKKMRGKGKEKKKMTSHGESDTAEVFPKNTVDSADLDTLAGRLGLVNRIFTNPFTESLRCAEKDNTLFLEDQAFTALFRRRRWELVQWAMESNPAERRKIANTLRNNGQDPLGAVLTFITSYEAAMAPSETEFLMQSDFNLPPSPPAPLAGTAGLTLADDIASNSDAGVNVYEDSLMTSSVLVSTTPLGGDTVEQSHAGEILDSGSTPLEISKDADDADDDDDDLYAQTQELGWKVPAKRNVDMAQLEVSESESSDDFDAPTKAPVSIGD